MKAAGQSALTKKKQGKGSALPGAVSGTVLTALRAAGWDVAVDPVTSQPYFFHKKKGVRLGSSAFVTLLLCRWPWV